MLWNYFYKVTDYIKQLSGVSVFIFILVIANISSQCKLNTQQTPTPVASKTPDSVRLAQVEKICYEIPKPEQFVFVDKSTLISTFSIEATYKYKTPRSYEEIVPNFSIWASSNGWQLISSGEWMEFQKDKYVVTVRNFNLASYNYTITCRDTAP